MVAELLSNEEYWNRPELVDAHSGRPGILPYEIDAVVDACARAGSTGEVQSVHVLGVGTGRELADIRRLTKPTRIHAWDISEPMVAGCEDLIRCAGWNDITVARASIDEIPGLMEQPADAVIALAAVLCYIPLSTDRLATFRAMHAMCRPGGGLAAVVQQRHARPLWGAYFAYASLLERSGLRHRGEGNRPSSYGDVAVMLHHYGRHELDDLLHVAGFADRHIQSLRRWASSNHRRIPRRSPNPLIAVATAR